MAIYVYQKSYDLEHSGIKGQKWGVRRYQNPDGSLTDEGRRRYGYGREAGRLMTKNTAASVKKGAKIGAAVKTGVGLAFDAGAITVGVALGLPAAAIPAVAVAAGMDVVVNAGTGAALGAGIGGIAGAISTRKGRKYIERYDKGLDDFERREGVR